MTELAPATLQRLIRVGKPVKNKPAKVTPDGDPLPVQFNPATLKITRKSNVDRAGSTAKTQKVQVPSTEPATLSFDLEFDTAEQGTVGRRVSVRKWTALLRQFVEPPTDDAAGPPPAVQFAWGTLVFKGIIEQITEDLDYFAPDGTPLHAKISVTISEQDFAMEATKGAVAKNSKAARDPGEVNAGTAPGRGGTDNPTQLVDALDGESAQQLLARLGKDPAAWRGAMSGVDSPLGLAAGATVQLGVEVDSGPGLGVAAHFAADAATTSPAGLSAALRVGVTDERSAGFALSTAGGITGAVTRVGQARAAAAVTASLGAFDVPRVSVEAVADARADTYGRGIPLQFRVTAAPGVASGRAPGGEAGDAEQRRRDAGATTLRWSPGR